jgi:hypothetical protein
MVSIQSSPNKIYSKNNGSFKKKYTKPTDFIIDPKKTNATKCVCIGNKQISQECLDNGICPTLKIISVHKGYKVTGTGKLKEGLDGVEIVLRFIEKIKNKKPMME